MIAVQEGAFLYEHNINPYSGDLYHENPLILFASNFLIRNAGPLIPYLFVACDLLCAFLLFKMAKYFTAEMVGVSNSIFSAQPKFLTLFCSLHSPVQRTATSTSALRKEHGTASYQIQWFSGYTDIRRIGLPFQSVRCLQLCWTNNNRLEQFIFGWIFLLSHSKANAALLFVLSTWNPTQFLSFWIDHTGIIIFELTRSQGWWCNRFDRKYLIQMASCALGRL